MMKNAAPTLISDLTIIKIFGKFTPLRTVQKFSPPYGNFRPYAYYIFRKFTPPTLISYPTLIRKTRVHNVWTTKFVQPS